MCTSCCALKAEFNDFWRNRRSAISFEKISKNVWFIHWSIQCGCFSKFNRFPPSKWHFFLILAYYMLYWLCGSSHFDVGETIYKRCWNKFCLAAWFHKINRIDAITIEKKYQSIVRHEKVKTFCEYYLFFSRSNVDDAKVSPSNDQSKWWFNC